MNKILLTMIKALHFSIETDSVGGDCRVGPHDEVDSILVDVRNSAAIAESVVGVNAFTVPIDIDISLFNGLITEASDDKSALLQGLISNTLILVIDIRQQAPRNWCSDSECVVEVGGRGEECSLGTILLDESPFDPSIRYNARAKVASNSAANLSPDRMIANTVLNRETTVANIETLDEWIVLTDIPADQSKENGRAGYTLIRIDDVFSFFLGTFELPYARSDAPYGANDSSSLSLPPTPRATGSASSHTFYHTCISPGTPCRD